MWTKDQLSQTLIRISGLVVLFLSIPFYFRYGVISFLIFVPIGLLGFIVSWLFARTLTVSSEQSEQFRTHVDELSHYLDEQKRISRELQTSEEKFRNAFEYASVGMAFVSINGHVRRMNRALGSILGVDEEKFLNSAFDNVIHLDDLDQYDRNLAMLIEDAAKSFQMECRATNGTGEDVWLTLSSSFVNDDNAERSHFIFQVLDITDRKRAEERLIHDALHDALTDLPNRVLFMDRLNVAFNRAQRHLDAHFAVLYLDFDRFKLVNDSFGHFVGDQLLVEAASRLRLHLRASDTIARLGGDEFAMLVEEIGSVEAALPLVERIRKEMSRPFDLNGQLVFASVSIGIATWTRDREKPEYMLRDADTALYQAKRFGRDRYEIFTSEMHADALKTLQIENDLHQAIDRREFRLFYQPIVDLRSGAISGFESLIRWQHPERGLVSPMEFIPIAEESGMILSIGEWVLGESCRQLRRWYGESEANRALWVSVNVSSKQFIQPNFVSIVHDALRESGIPASSLKLEITESAMVDNIDLVVDVMEQLKELGVKLSIDDFGTGYSSLSFLHRLPLSSLKIDRSFVMRMNESAENEEIVKTIVALAKSLNLEIIAEGVETADQLAQLRGLSCQLGQGYLFARPLDVESADKIIGDNIHKSIIPETPPALSLV